MGFSSVSEMKKDRSGNDGDMGDGEGPGGVKADSQEVCSPS